MYLTGNLLLQIGGILSFAIALLHQGIIFAGAPECRYFGTGEKIAEMAEADLSALSILLMPAK